MGFAQFYSDPQKFVCSVEVFPPKTAAGTAALLHELELLKPISPAFVSVTYGAMGSTRNLTEDLALQIFENTKIPTAFHFTCIGSGRQEIAEYVRHLAEKGLDLVVALRGDLPEGQGKFVPPIDGFAHANELVAYLKTLWPLSIAVAGYPEKHKEAVSLEIDLQNLKRKVDAGADAVLTQLFFNNDDFYRFVDAARVLQIHVPIIPGIMPIQNLKQLEKITAMCAAKIPQNLRSKLEHYAQNAEAQIEIGIEHAQAQCADLQKQGVAGVHFYSLNKANPVLQIMLAL